MATRTHIVQASFVEAPLISLPEKPYVREKLDKRPFVKRPSASAADSEMPVAETHFAILQLGVSIWNQWRASEPLTRPTLRNADLSGFHLENINFCRADLQGANLSSAYLYEADFQEADLRRANFTGAGLIGANLHGAIASGANFQRAYLAQSDLSNARFTKASLQKANLQAALVTDAILTKATIAEADFTGSFDLTQAQLESAKEAYLACFDAGLRTAMGLAPSESAAEPLECEVSAQAAHTDVSIGAFQPTHQLSANKPALRKLALS